MFLRLVFLLLFGAISRLYAQEAFSDNLPTKADAKPGEPTPESAWLDLRQNTPRHSTPQNAPPWVEAVTLFPAQGTGDAAPKTVFRIRVARPSQDYQVLLFRLFFDDKPGQQPELVAWDESGTHILRSGALGSGINLPASDSVMIPMTDTSSIDIEVFAHRRQGALWHCHCDPCGRDNPDRHGYSAKRGVSIRGRGAAPGGAADFRNRKSAY